MKNDIFKTLKDYSTGYHRTATPEECNIYDAEVERIKTRILADIEHTPEIIAEEFSKLWATEYRRLFSGVYSTFATTPEYKAVDNVYMSLLDSKPLKSITVTQCNAKREEHKLPQTVEELYVKIQKIIKNKAGMTAYAAVGETLKDIKTADLMQWLIDNCKCEISIRAYLEEQVIGTIINLMRYRNGQCEQ